ncbi:MAG TPA: hypothetical protein VEP70_04545 [Burkholderiales bacterium]|nr:hypothetical protein [Burkholderiales bacterium]
MSSVRSTADGMIRQAPGGSTAADSSRAAVGSPARRFLAALVTVVCAGVLLIAGANYSLDPLHFSASGQRQVAAVLLSGKNYAVFDANMDFRGLRREAIAQMNRTPQVIVFGGSRFELATPDLFPGKTFYNGFVHNDVFEDLVAFSGLLYEHKRLPKNLVLTVRYKTFLPIDPVLRETDEFKLFWSEYRSMADRLGIEKESLLDVVPLGYWSHLLSVDNIVRHVAYRLDGKQQGPVDAATMDNMDVIHADGSMAFSKEHSESFRTILLSRGVTNMFSSADTIDQDSEQRAAKMSKRAAWPVDPNRLEGLGVLLAFLKKEGTHVTIAITPFHPA